MFNRRIGSSSFGMTQAPVDPSRIQALLAIAMGTVKELDSGREHFDEVLHELRRSSPHTETERDVAGHLFNSISTYIGRDGLLPSSASTTGGPSVLAFLDGLDFDYQLSETDLLNVFGRFGHVVNVSVSPDGSNAVVTFGGNLPAMTAASELNAKSLSGFSNGSLRVVPYGWGNSACASAVPLIRKYTCRFDIQIENDKEFHVARRIIGQKGCNMKRIVKQAGFDAKLRLRGRGSGFLEGSQKQESQEPLHLCVSCKEYQGYRSAVDQVDELLEVIYNEFKEYCMMKGQSFSENLRVIMHEHPLLYQPGSLEVSNHLSPPLTPMEPIPLEAMDVEQLIEARNEARRTCNFKEADRIREVLKSRGIGLMDEPGGRGRGVEVTSWRVWR